MGTNTVHQGDLFFLLHEGAVQFSGYGLVVESGCPHHLVGLLMIDRPQPASAAWLRRVEEAFGQVDLYAMTPTGERGLACQMWIEEASLVHLRQVPGALSQLLQVALLVLLVELPAVQLDVAWDATQRLWVSTFHKPAKADTTTNTSAQTRLPRFALGAVVATPGALDALEEAGQPAQEFLHRHVSGDWGELDEHDRQANERAVRGGDRILSAYYTKHGTKLWVITEYDRSVTTLLLPSEY